MALFQCNFSSYALNVSTSVNVILPQILTRNEDTIIYDKRKFKTLYLLHGYYGDHTDWCRYTSIERYATEKQLAVVMPAINNSFYTDMKYGSRYWTYVSEELPNYLRTVFPLSDKREDNFVAGLSMGGYGAFKLALNKPETFSAAISLSGAVDLIHSSNTVVEDHMIQQLTNVFGDLESIKDSDNDLFNVLNNLINNKIDIPKLYLSCGTEDFLYEGNVNFKNLAEKLNVDLTYIEAPGGHTWEYWDEHIKKAISWLPI